MVLPLVILDCVFRALTDFLVITKHRLHIRGLFLLVAHACLPVLFVLCRAYALNKRCLKMLDYVFIFIQAIFVLPKSDAKAIGPANTSSVTGHSRRIFHIPTEYTNCVLHVLLGNRCLERGGPLQDNLFYLSRPKGLIRLHRPHQNQVVTAQLFPLVASLYGHN